MHFVQCVRGDVCRLVTRLEAAFSLTFLEAEPKIPYYNYCFLEQSPSLSSQPRKRLSPLAKAWLNLLAYIS